MVAENASQGFEQLKVKWLSDTDTLESAMEEIQERLNLPRLPRRMECYDISNIQGTTPVGSMVVFEDGQARSSHYRRFKIKTVEGIDDYSMMQEMLRRRFERLGHAEGKGKAADDESPSEEGREQGQSWGLIPDLVLIDGGKGHLNAVVEVFLELGIDNVPLASLAKQEEEIFVRGTPESIMLPRSSPALFLVQRLRDEAHRFAVTYHQRSRTKKGMQSAMDLVPGIGPKRGRMLIRRFGSVRGVREASLEDLAAVPGMTRTLAQKVKEFL
jgi:excinuclease ABC subunit C